MKKSFLVILASTIILATVFPLLLTACVPVVVVTAENLVQNPGFEEPTNGCTGAPDNWTPTGASLGRSTDDYSGNCSAYINGTDSSYTQTVRVEGVTFYRFGGYIKANESTATLELTIQDSDGELVESSVLYLINQSITTLETYVLLSTNQTVWEKNIVYLGTPDTAYYAVIKLEMTPGENASNPEAWFDDILLEAKAECFIATAAYGTPLVEEIEVLRQFRDEYLVTNPAGRLLVSLYYTSSPPLAHLISKHDSLKAVTRMALEPIIWFCSRIIAPPSP